MKKSSRKPFAVILLIILLVFQSISGLFGGIQFILAPSGDFIQMPIISLAHTPFSDFTIPGLILFLLLGVFPGFTAYCLASKPAWKWADKLNLYENRYFAWACSVYIAVMLFTWITVEIQMIGYGHFIQTFYAFLGIFILVTALLPGVMAFYEKKAD